MGYAAPVPPALGLGGKVGLVLEVLLQRSDLRKKIERGSVVISLYVHDTLPQVVSVFALSELMVNRVLRALRACGLARVSPFTVTQTAQEQGERE